MPFTMYDRGPNQQADDPFKNLKRWGEVIMLVLVLGTLVATCQQNNVMKDTLRMDQRAWVSAEYQIVKPLTFDEAGNVYITLNVMMKNVGKSVALNVLPWVSLVLLDLGEGYMTPLALQERECDKRRYQKIDLKHMSGAALFPEQEVSLPHPSYARITAERIKQAVAQVPPEKKGQIGFAVVGCVSYRASFEDLQEWRHQTRSMFFLAHQVEFGINQLVKPEGTHEDMKLVNMLIGESAD